MRNRLRRLLPHAAILICNMYIVFFLIDRVNNAMNFIDNRLTKGLLLALCVVTWFNCRTLLRLESAPRRPAPPHNAPPRRPQSAYPPARRSGYDDYYAPRRGSYAPRYGGDANRRPTSSASRYSEGRYR